MEKVVGIIPARGGSKRVPGKNKRDLNGRPLLVYTIEAALKSGIFDEVIVSSDEEEILNIASAHGAIPLLRSKALSSDTTKVFEVLHQFLLDGDNSKKYKALAALLPTCPFKTPVQIREAYELFLQHEGRANIISVNKFDYPPQLGFTMNPDDNDLTMTHPEVFARTTRSQDIPAVYHSNGAIWIASVENYLQHKTFYKGKMVGYVMDALSSFDIDFPWQFEVAEMLAKKITNNEEFFK